MTFLEKGDTLLGGQNNKRPLMINIEWPSLAHLLKKVDFHTVVDHLAITHIMKGKAKPATTRIKRLLELLSSYSFNLYYIKGKEMVLSDFLSRQ